jgi:metal-sulfur cluster biosynthetic enzyme
MSDTSEVQEYTPEEQALRDALRTVTDPEPDMNIVNWADTAISIQPDFTEIKMIATMPECRTARPLEQTRRAASASSHAGQDLRGNGDVGTFHDGGRAASRMGFILKQPDPLGRPAAPRVFFCRTHDEQSRISVRCAAPCR